jgi:hypothetical protein
MMDRELLTELLGEGFHTAFRKATDCDQAPVIYRLIEEMPEDDWANVLDFVADCLPTEKFKD